MRRFLLRRDVDETGVSGTGDVAQGVEFDDGRACLRWLTDTASTCAYDSMGDLELIHGHGGKTRIVWLDLEPVECGARIPTTMGTATCRKLRPCPAHPVVITRLRS